MIVKMKKVTLLCLADDKSATLEELRNLGVLHLAPVKQPESDDLDKVRSQMQQAESARAILSAYSTDSNADIAPVTDKTGEEVIQATLRLAQRKKELVEKQGLLENERSRLEPFGDFDPAALQRLAKAGIVVKLYHTSSNKPPIAPENIDLFVIRSDKSNIYFALVGRSDVEFDADEFTLPNRSLSSVAHELETLKPELTELEKELRLLNASLNTVECHIASLTEQLQYLEARDGMGTSEKLAYLQGFCPTDLVEKIKNASATHGWGLTTDDPTEEDAIPTLVRYPAWVRVMRPVFKFLGITPGYKETDISSSFFVFLSIFFAMIVGDAGYGILFLILTPYFRKKKFSNSAPEPFRLLYIFSACTILWGVVTGNYFGIEYEFLPTVLQSLRIDWLIDQGNSMTFSLALGAIHLTLAHGWKAVRFGRDARAIVQVGWICIIWGIFALARQLLVGSTIPTWFTPIPIAGILAVVVGLILTKQWMDLGLLMLNLVSCFGDIMSYLRLFALGIASVKVAEAFNGMAGDAGAALIGMFEGGIQVWGGVALAAFAMTLILMMGHALNIILCALSVLVHGVRLNALEFSLHMGQEWSGFEYKPFAGRVPADLESTA